MSQPFREEDEMSERETMRQAMDEVERAKRNARRFAEMKRQYAAEARAGTVLPRREASQRHATPGLRMVRG